MTLLAGFLDVILRGLGLVALPLWFYVSVTGVVVYWMLYHLYPVS